MVLYEFVYTDERGIAVEDLFNQLEEMLMAEADIQGWAEGWRLTIPERVGRMKGSATDYYCVVSGEYDRVFQ
jgi:hypothetical protein